MRQQKYLTNIINMKKISIVSVLVIILFIGCKSVTPIAEIEIRGDEITFKFIQLNDVYEVAPLSGGKYGGMARVAYVRDSIARVNPNTYMFMAGDFLNPSLIGTVKVDGERVNGKHMIEVMNAMNFELVTFGNHEFDIGEKALQKRLNESNFTWISSNVRQNTSSGEQPFRFQRDLGNIPINDTYIITIPDNKGNSIKIGFFSVTLDSNPQKFVSYEGVFSAAEKAYQSLEGQVDLIFGLTHLEIEQDIELAKRLPKVQFIMGGHEHNSMLVPSGDAFIAKADANAKTVYIHTFTYNRISKNLNIDSHLFPIDEKIKSKPSVAAVVDKWNGILTTKLKEVIEDPNEVIYSANPPLDGTDSANRGIQTNMGDLLTEAMAASFEEPAEVALVNGGSIRLDDMLTGEVTSLDIFRVLPFGGNVVKVKMNGQLLFEVLNYGKSAGGTGAYLQRYNIEESDLAGWMIGGKPLQMNKTYTVALSDFLLKGYDIPFLTPKHEGVLDVYQPKPAEVASDIRKAVIVYLKSLKE